MKGKKQNSPHHKIEVDLQSLYSFPLRVRKSGSTTAKRKWLEAVSTLNEILLDPSANLREGIQAVNEMLTVIENVLLEGFFREYDAWLRDAENKGESMPASIVEKGEKAHKLILSRGKFILSLLSKLREIDNKEEETQLTSSLFTTPDWLEEDGDNDDDEV